MKLRISKKRASWVSLESVDILFVKADRSVNFKSCIEASAKLWREGEDFSKGRHVGNQPVDAKKVSA